MWKNFSMMPNLLKFITAHALGCLLFLLFSIIPHDSFLINGQNVSYHEWWASGAGVSASLIGILLPIGGLGLLKNIRQARRIYITALILATAIPFVLLYNLVNVVPYLIAAITIISGITAYLYLNGTAQNYFTSNKSIETDAE
jgi:hypothetical protein